MLIMSTREIIITDYIDAYNHFDIERMLLHLDEAVLFENISGGAVNLSLDGLAAFKEQAVEAANLFSQRKQTIISWRHDEQMTEVEISFHAVLAADLPNGLKKGAELNLQGKSVFRFSGDKIIGLKDFS
jgi:hypothetical protein